MTLTEFMLGVMVVLTSCRWICDLIRNSLAREANENQVRLLQQGDARRERGGDLLPTGRPPHWPAPRVRRKVERW